MANDEWRIANYELGVRTGRLGDGETWRAGDGMKRRILDQPPRSGDLGDDHGELRIANGDLGLSIGGLGDWEKVLKLFMLHQAQYKFRTAQDQGMFWPDEEVGLSLETRRA
jgi:hypothetical protein